jgi:transposase
MVGLMPRRRRRWRNSLLMEQLDYNSLFRRFAGLNVDDSVWDASTFSKNRERLLEGEGAGAFFDQVWAQVRERPCVG